MYKIIHFESATGQVVLRYASDQPPVAVDLPINEHGLFPVGDELRQYLSGFVPVIDTTRRDALAAGVANEDQIATLVEPDLIVAQENTEAPHMDAEAQAELEAFEREQFSQRVRDVLVQLGVISQ